MSHSSVGTCVGGRRCKGDQAGGGISHDKTDTICSGGKNATHKKRTKPQSNPCTQRNKDKVTPYRRGRCPSKRKAAATRAAVSFRLVPPLSPRPHLCAGFLPRMISRCGQLLVGAHTQEGGATGPATDGADAPSPARRLGSSTSTSCLHRCCSRSSTEGGGRLGRRDCENRNLGRDCEDRL